MSLKKDLGSCPDCGGDIAIRNPTGTCDHLYYPELTKTGRQEEWLLKFRMTWQVARPELVDPDARYIVRLDVDRRKHPPLDIVSGRWLIDRMRYDLAYKARFMAKIRAPDWH